MLTTTSLVVFRTKEISLPRYEYRINRVRFPKEMPMSEKPRLNRNGECDVCGLMHDEEIHQATLNVHLWFRNQVTQYLREEEVMPEVQVA